MDISCPLCKLDVAALDYVDHVPLCYIEYCKKRNCVPRCTCNGCHGKQTHPGDRVDGTNALEEEDGLFRKRRSKRQQENVISNQAKRSLRMDLLDSEDEQNAEEMEMEAELKPASKAESKPAAKADPKPEPPSIEVYAADRQVLYLLPTVCLSITNTSPIHLHWQLPRADDMPEDPSARR